MQHRLLSSVVGFGVAVALACVAPAAFGAGASTAGAPSPAIAKAIADPARPPPDRDADARRRPADLLAFAGVKPGDRVADLIPGSGYFTRLFSSIVGPKGRVYAVAPPPRPDTDDPAAPVKEIAADARYGNVEVLVQRVSQLKLPEPMDLVWTSLNYHDFHNVQGVAVAEINRAIFESLKPGGTFVVVDHAADPGSGLRDTSTRHRIDEQTVKDEVTAAGFEFVGRSPVLGNPNDGHDLPVFDPRIRFHTDQFVLKFRRPAR